MNKKGFTLIELIIVIAIIALLAAATFVAVDPAKRIGEARNAQRWSDVTAIADAYMNYLVDHNGTVAATAVTTAYIAHTASSSCSSDPSACTASTTAVTECIDLHNLVINGYLGDIPDDPGGTNNDSSGYYFMKDSATNAVTVGACTTYDSATIKVVR